MDADDKGDVDVVVCKYCDGRGFDYVGPHTFMCSDCDGKGVTELYPDDEEDGDDCEAAAE